MDKINAEFIFALNFAQNLTSLRLLSFLKKSKIFSQSCLRTTGLGSARDSPNFGRRNRRAWTSIIHDSKWIQWTVRTRSQPTNFLRPATAVGTKKISKINIGTPTSYLYIYTGICEYSYAEWHRGKASRQHTSYPAMRRTALLSGVSSPPSVERRSSG